MVLVEETCCHEGCNVVFGMTKGQYDELQKTGALFYCPNGHSQHFTENEEMRFQKRLKAKEDIIKQLEENIITIKQEYEQKCKAKRKAKRISKGKKHLA